MKTIYTFILLIIFQFAVAQDIDSTTVFETEQVSEFKKQTIVDEFLVPYEADEDVTRMFRIGLSSSFSGGFYAQRIGSTNFIDFQTKVGIANSIGVGVALPTNNFVNTFLTLTLIFVILSGWLIG